MEFFSYFCKTENIVNFIEFLFFGVLALLLYKKTGDTSVLKKILGGYIMKYRTANYIDDVKARDKGTTFEQFSHVYRLNKVTGELEDTGELIDIQEQINSCVSACLTEVLSKFFPDNVPIDDDNIVEVERMTDDLDALHEAFQVAESYRSALGLSDMATTAEIFAAMDAKRKDLWDKLNKKEKEVLSDEKENDKKGE